MKGCSSKNSLLFFFACSSFFLTPWVVLGVAMLLISEEVRQEKKLRVADELFEPAENGQKK
jgi:hypothetical protein